jgi:hypothetical protein
MIGVLLGGMPGCTVADGSLLGVGVDELVGVLLGVGVDELVGVTLGVGVPEAGAVLLIGAGDDVSLTVG